MGNYYEIVNFDKRERIGCPDLLTWDIKWSAFANGGPPMRVLAYLIANGTPDCITKTMTGRWYGDRVGIVGDFSEDSETTDEFLDITPMLMEEFEKSAGGRRVMGLPDEHT